ncbi:NPK1-related protein kinase [Leptomonas pyrrhocoris]|uniref:NPK1-related protein kinase n=1 Tax=Leptomonas pyrrhocoris TaxID=157538 RepID=A0A0N0VES7_LEPPY|nr:NPK1-related protein kinase [Leptomonas pyrrhocoris]KPA79221.1 NPK1-related protein kinase [Leptomonas pyrrhocoris]|eukprot:XP_015657660.1 NPK1-related protein kinase [Leptomonas pyrrhocoris]
MSGGGEQASASGDGTAACRQCGSTYHKTSAKFCSRCGASREIAGNGSRSNGGGGKGKASGGLDDTVRSLAATANGLAGPMKPPLLSFTAVEAGGPAEAADEAVKGTLRPFDVELLRRHSHKESSADAVGAPLEFRDPSEATSLTSPKRCPQSSTSGPAPPPVSAAASSSPTLTSLSASRPPGLHREARKSSIYAKDNALPELPPASLADPRRFTRHQSESEEEPETKLAATSVSTFSGSSARPPAPPREQPPSHDGGGGGRPSSASSPLSHTRKRSSKSQMQEVAVEDAAAFADSVVAAAPTSGAKEGNEKPKQKAAAAEDVGDGEEATGSLLRPSAEEEAQYTAWATLSPDGLTPEMLQTSNAGELRKWRKGSLIGRGTYGSVYLGLLPDGSFFAVKSVELGNRKTGADHLNALELVSLSREINMMHRLRHRNLCTFKGVYYDAENMAICMFMEYIGGGSLSALVKRFKPLPPSVVRSWTKQLLCGLLYLHTQHIIHRDIKGDNVLVDTSADPSSLAQIKLVDFGAARRLTDAVSQSSTVIGTPYWMAPEVVDASGEGGGYSYKADVWSVGCTVAEMLTGRPPWPCKTSAPAAIMMIASATGMPTEIPEKEATAGCLDFMRQCFIRDPEKRPTVQMLLQHPWIQGKVD